MLHRKKTHKDNSEIINKSRKTSFLQAVALIFVSIIVFFGVLEIILSLANVQPVLSRHDPFVGFAGNVPLYEEYLKGPDGQRILSTSSNKMHLFNRQVFPEQKAENTYRIFTVGGSTTYGRPYDDSTSFSAWLRELLPETQKVREWEVINAGGISYASYRVARLMEELVQYDPDMFIVYTGQNEFLEERTYRNIKKVPEIIRSTTGLLARTRTWTVMSSLLNRADMLKKTQDSSQSELSAEVNTLLENSTGPKDYHRDDELSDGVLEHFRVSLERIANLAQQAGADLIFVTPASNLKDCSPFKSEHTTGLDEEGQRRTAGLIKLAKISMGKGNFQQALETLDTALSFDSRFAELHYARGKALFKLGRYDDAHLAFKRARDEDVCPLRALTPMRDIVVEVARQKNIPVVDYIEIVEAKTLADNGYRIPGEELFLDHVHPTIDGHKLLALALLDKMVTLDIVQPKETWDKKAAIDAAESRIESNIDPNFQAMALINLSKVLLWAGKNDDAERSAIQALKIKKVDAKHAVLAINQLIKVSRQEKDWAKIDKLIDTAIKLDPWSPIMHHQLALRFVQEKKLQRGISHILLSRAFWDTNQTNSLLGLLLYQGGRYELAYPILKRALNQNPGDKVTRVAFDTLQKKLGFSATKLSLPDVVVERSANSGLPRNISIQSSADQGKSVPDGIFTEWYTDGTLKRYVEYSKGVMHGSEVEWDHAGDVQSHIFYKHGKEIKK